jgi:hypothetical protein
VSKHIAKNPKKYAAGATAVAGAGIYNEYVKGRKMMALTQKLKST